MTLTEVLEELGIPTAPAGHKNVRAGWVAFSIDPLPIKSPDNAANCAKRHTKSRGILLTEKSLRRPFPRSVFSLEPNNLCIRQLSSATAFSKASTAIPIAILPIALWGPPTQIAQLIVTLNIIPMTTFHPFRLRTYKSQQNKNVDQIVFYVSFITTQHNPQVCTPVLATNRLRIKTPPITQNPSHPISLTSTRNARPAPTAPNRSVVTDSVLGKPQELKRLVTYNFRHGLSSFQARVVREGGAHNAPDPFILPKLRGIFQ
jgi:hypothetical protein